MELTQEYIKLILDYDPSTGMLTHKTRARSLFSCSRQCKIWNTQNAGNVAGSKKQTGYIAIAIGEGRTTGAHRLIFLFMTGRLPSNEVDHINGIRDDNRWENLRAVTGPENMRNQKMHSTNTTGVCGVSWNTRVNKLKALVTVNRKQIFLGYYDTIFDAAAARISAQNKHGFTARHGIKAVDKVS